MLPPDTASHVNVKAIVYFYESALGKRFCNAEKAFRFREMPFMVKLDSHVLDASLPKGEKSILVQGIIDCLWKEADGWVLVDYKSDRIAPNEAVQELNRRYAAQLRMYRYAVEQILGEPVKECYFYLLSQNRIIPLIENEKTN